MGLLGKGSYGCVYSPAIKCESNDDSSKLAMSVSNRKTRREVSKVFVNDDAYKKELKAVRLAATVDPTGQSLLLPTKACKITRDQLDRVKDAKKCSKIYEESPRKRTFYQLTMPYGGKRFDHALKEMMFGVPFEDFLDMIEPLMQALISLEKQKVCHNDIKGANALLTPQGKGIVIDHTLMVPFSSVYAPSHYRRLKMDYFPYPPEYKIVHHILHSDSDSDSDHAYNLVSNFKHSLKDFGNDRYEAYKNFVSEKTLDAALKKVQGVLQRQLHDKDSNDVIEIMSQYVNKVDVYGMGMLFVTVYKYINFSREKNHLVARKKLSKLVFSMINPDVTCRATPEEAMSMYKSLRTSSLKKV
jgi:serine/threonine protein kinase